MTTRRRRYVKWIVLTPRKKGKYTGTLVSRRVLGNEALDTLFKNGKAEYVLKDLTLFASSLNSCETLTTKVKSTIVDHLVQPSLHWSRRFNAIGEFLFWNEYLERIDHRTPEDISTATQILNAISCVLVTQKSTPFKVSCTKLKM